MVDLKVTGRGGVTRAIAIVDDADRLLKYMRWHFCNGYVATTLHGTEVYLHRMVMKAAPGDEVDHREGNLLDNRRSELRLVTRAQNAQNLGLRRDSQSGKRGVSWAPHVQLWRGRVYHDGETHHVGYYGDVEAAGDAVSAKRRALMTHSEESRHGS